jgi:hypothetical protein
VVGTLLLLTVSPGNHKAVTRNEYYLLAKAFTEKTLLLLTVSPGNHKAVTRNEYYLLAKAFTEKTLLLLTSILHKYPKSVYGKE